MYTKMDIQAYVLFILDGIAKKLRGRSEKSCKVRFNNVILGNIFVNRVRDRWNSLDHDTVDAPSLNCLEVG